MEISLLSPNRTSLPKLLELSKNLHDHEALSFDATYAKNAFTYLIDNPHLGNIFLIATKNETQEEIIGFIVICYSFSIEYGGQIAVLDQVFLSVDWRRQGVGAQLLPIIEAHCRERQCYAINLEINIGNSGARKFYERFDYTPRRQHCIMTKRLIHQPV